MGRGVSIRVPEGRGKWYIDRCHVEEGEAVSPGIPLMDLVFPGGYVRTITAECHGIVAHIENLPECSNDDFFKPSPYSGGDVVCHIVSRSDRSTKGADLRPRPSIAMRRLRFG